MLLLPLKYKRRFSVRTEWRLLIRVATVIVVIRMALRWMSYDRLCSYLDHTSKPGKNAKRLSFDGRRRVIWAVRSLSKRMLGRKPCLTQALALQWFLRRRGDIVQVHIGVRKNEEGTFMAHAWLERKGHVLIGGKRSPLSYVPLKRKEESIQ